MTKVLSRMIPIPLQASFFKYIIFISFAIIPKYKKIMSSTIYYIIIAVLVFDYVLERVLDILNSKMRDKELPEEVKDIYDDEKYKKQQAYEKETGNFSLITSTISFITMLGMILFGGFAFVDAYVVGITDNPILAALLFFGILMLASDLIGTPFDIYSTFVIEEKYGFNKMTVKTFIFDKVKGWLLGALLGGGVLSLIIWFIGAFPNNFWLLAWAAVGVIMIFFTMFYSSLIVPLFNKQTPLEEGDLKSSINDFSGKVGFKLDNIFVIDGSKRSTKANAYFSGLGAKKRIVLFDTLIKDLNVKEIVAVLAHEIGHYKKKHTLSMIAISLLQLGVMFFVLSLLIGRPELSQALGVNEARIHISLIVFGMLYSPLSFIIGILMNIFSRKNEYEADTYAAENYESEPLQTALKKLSRNNLSNLTPHPAYVFFHYSHPPIAQRLRHLMKFK